ncbi:MAG: DUF4136 domain-containing protein [Cyclobacteriaceae bacterium]|jgi:hypothetical protein|nr:DUF4136 domain-containing protein [Cyclobacteriaceae bacterium]
MRFLFVIILCLLAACSPVRILNIYKAEGFTLKNYKTFDFFKVDASGELSPSYMERVDLIKAEIANHLTQRGLQQTSSSPDLLLNIGIVVEEKEQTRETSIMDAPRYIGQRNYHWESEEVVVNRYKEGMVTVHFVDRETNRLVCEGIASAVIVQKDEAVKKNITEGVRKLFEEMGE